MTATQVSCDQTARPGKPAGASPLALFGAELRH